MTRQEILLEVLKEYFLDAPGNCFYNFMDDKEFEQLLYGDAEVIGKLFLKSLYYSSSKDPKQLLKTYFQEMDTWGKPFVVQKYNLKELKDGD